MGQPKGMELNLKTGEYEKVKVPEKKVVEKPKE